MSDGTTSKKGIDWGAIACRFYEHNQQLLRDNAGLLKGPAAQALWPAKEDGEGKTDE